MNNQNKLFQIRLNRRIAKQILFTVAYYNALGYYPTSFFVWKNLIDMDRNKKEISLLLVLKTLKSLEEKKIISSVNGLCKLTEYQKTTAVIKQEDWYERQIQRDKISTDKIKKIKRLINISRWIPYLRDVFLTGTLAMKRGDINSDWDVLVVLKKNRIWLGRLVFAVWLQLVGKRRYDKKIKDRFCLNQFVVEDKLKFKEHNEFFGNELVMAKSLFENVNLKNDIIQKNSDWIKAIKPNIEFKKMNNKIIYEKKKQLNGVIQMALEKLLEASMVGEILNKISKKIMIKKIINNPKTYASRADIRYSDFFLVFLPSPQRDLVRIKVFKALTKINY